MAGCHPIDAQSVIEIFFKTTGLATGADVAEGRLAAAADRTTEARGIQVFEGGAGDDPHFFDPFFRVIDVTAAAALEAVVAIVALGFNRSG